MKKLFTLFSLFCIAAIAATAQEEPVYFKTNGLRYIVTDAQAATAALTYTDDGYSGDLIIPSTALNPDDNKTYSITALGQEALYHSQCTSVTLPASVVTIAEDAFFNAYISRYAVAEDNPAFTVSDDILYSKDMTRIVSFPNQKDFAGYTLPESVTEIGPYAFCSVWLTEFTVPERITMLGRGAFMATKLKTFTVPATVTSLGGSLLQNCQSLKSVTLEEGITVIPDHFLTSSWMLEELNLPSTLTEIQDYAFSRTFVYSYGKLITSLTLPDNVARIGIGAFEANYALTSFTLGEKTETISYYAFSNCSNLKELTCKAAVPPFCQSLDYGTSSPAEVFNEVPANCPVYVPESALTAYRNDWGEKFNDFRPIPDQGGIDAAVTSENLLVITTAAGCLSVASPSAIEVFAANGLRVAHTEAGDLNIALPSGVYIVRSGEETRKVVL